jgi:hypothetical protein
MGYSSQGTGAAAIALSGKTLSGDPAMEKVALLSVLVAIISMLAEWSQAPQRPQR